MPFTLIVLFFLLCGQLGSSESCFSLYLQIIKLSYFRLSMGFVFIILALEMPFCFHSHLSGCLPLIIVTVNKRLWTLIQSVSVVSHWGFDPVCEVLCEFITTCVPLDIKNLGCNISGGSSRINVFAETLNIRFVIIRQHISSFMWKGPIAEMNNLKGNFKSFDSNCSSGFSLWKLFI